MKALKALKSPNIGVDLVLYILLGGSTKNRLKIKQILQAHPPVLYDRSLSEVTDIKIFCKGKSETRKTFLFEEREH